MLFEGAPSVEDLSKPLNASLSLPFRGLSSLRDTKVSVFIVFTFQTHFDNYTSIILSINISHRTIKTTLAKFVNSILEMAQRMSTHFPKIWPCYLI